MESAASNSVESKAWQAYQREKCDFWSCGWSVVQLFWSCPNESEVDSQTAGQPHSLFALLAPPAPEPFIYSPFSFLFAFFSAVLVPLELRFGREPPCGHHRHRRARGAVRLVVGSRPKEAPGGHGVRCARARAVVSSPPSRYSSLTRYSALFIFRFSDDNPVAL